MYKFKNIIIICLIIILTIPNLVYSSNYFKDECITLIPIRDFFESKDFHVEWNQKDKSIKVIKGGTKFNFNTKLNVKEHDIFPSLLIESKSYFSVKLLNEFGFTYKFDKNNEINIEKIINKGDIAPSFVAKTLNNEMFISDNNPKKILMFWASWCPFCKDTLNSLNNINNQIEDDNVKIITISIDKNRDDAIELLNKYNYSISTIVDDGNILNKYNPRVVPTIYLIENNKIKKVIEGNVDILELISFINE